MAPAAASEGLNVGGEGAAVGCGVGALVGQRGPAYEGLAVVIDETQMRFR